MCELSIFVERRQKGTLKFITRGKGLERGSYRVFSKAPVSDIGYRSYQTSPFFTPRENTTYTPIPPPSSHSQTGRV